MIVSQIKNDELADNELADNEIETEEISFIQTEREGLGESKHDRHRIRELMEQSGASEIVED